MTSESDSSPDHRLAWELFVELTTRVATQPLAPDEGLAREALSSLHQLFGRVRDLLALHGEPSAASGPATAESLAWTLLNGQLRPLLARWHPDLTVYEQQLGAPDDAHWPKNQAFRRALEQLRHRLTDTAITLGLLAGVANPQTLLPSAPDPKSERPIATASATTRTRDLAMQVYSLLDQHAAALPFHGTAHTEFVARKASEFAAARGADVELVEAAALVDDLNYLVAPNSAPEAGQDLRTRLLAASGFTPAEAQRIETIIVEAHTRSRQRHVDPETACLADADSLYKALPITPVLFAHRYLEQNHINLEDLARKIVDEQATKLAAGYYFCHPDMDRYRAWAEINLRLWEAILDALADADVAHLISCLPETRTEAARSVIADPACRCESR